MKPRAAAAVALALALVLAMQPVAEAAGYYRLLTCVKVQGGQYLGDYADASGSVIRKAFYYPCPASLFQ